MPVNAELSPCPSHRQRESFFSCIWTDRRIYEAAEELGRRCAEGIPLRGAPPESWWVENGSLHIPAPGTSKRMKAPPDRFDLEDALNRFLDLPEAAACRWIQKLRALNLFCGQLPLPAADLHQWKRVFLTQQKNQLRSDLRLEYRRTLTSDTPVSEDGIRGQWNGEKTVSLDHLKEEVTRSFLHPVEILKRGSRATLWKGVIADQEVIIKRYEPNPRRWRRPLETCRALRAWAGGTLLKSASIAAPEPLGWLQVMSGADRGVSVFITSPVPESETVRTWLRREWPKMSPGQRIQFRHCLRDLLLELYSKGLVHLDCKLSNLRIAATDRSGSPVFIWTDLEDIRPRRWLGRTFLRNLYQLNGSLPRFISRGHRIQFLKGFHSLFPYASASWVVTYVARVTRRRHLREIRRQCGA